jgi:hypothetical protein
MEKLRQELATTFKTDSEISFASLSQLKILNAVIKRPSASTHQYQQPSLA